MAHHSKKRLRYHKIGGTHPSWSLPSRAADEPFCAYFGPHGEFCAETTDLENVFSIAGSPDLAETPALVWMACPAHREHVQRRADAFAQRSQHAPQTLAFTYQGTTFQAHVTEAHGTTEDTC
ncbi:MAG: hypothetical protein ACRDHZ_01960 [Ktedonobacteraceae bacterium]